MKFITSFAVALFSSTLLAKAPAMPNEFPIVTHWNSSLNGGKGGPQLGSTDYVAAVVGTSGAVYLPDFFDEDKSSPYTFDTKAHPLFSGDASAPSAQTPDLERYVGENYSIYAIDESVALKFSDDVYAATGFSTLHLNGDETCRANDIKPNVNYFQIIHACPIGEKDKQSLATIIIPPNFDPKKAGGYPLLFYPYYDIHLTFMGYGRTVANSIGTVVKTNLGSGIGVLWNGGAALGTYGLQTSAYRNASLLFEMLETNFNANIEAIVGVGCSRGGTTSLALAGNPNPRNYKMLEVIAYSPGVAFGTRDSQYVGPTYPGFFSTWVGLTGYKYSWREEWREPSTGYRGYERASQNTFGTIDPIELDKLSPISDRQLNSLKASGTQVTLNVGTNDQYSPFALYTSYANKAREIDIPLKLRIAHRGAHCRFGNMSADSVAALLRANLGDRSFTSQVEHFEIQNPDLKNKEINFVQFNPTSTPVSVELPRYVARECTFTYSLNGPPKTYYRLEIFSKGSSAPVQVFSGQLPDVSPMAFAQIASTRDRVSWPSSIPAGRYFYKLSYSSDQVTWLEASYVPVVKSQDPHAPATLTILDNEPMVNGDDFCGSIFCQSTGWGLSSR